MCVHFFVGHVSSHAIWRVNSGPRFVNYCVVSLGKTEEGLELLRQLPREDPELNWYLCIAYKELRNGSKPPCAQRYQLAGCFRGVWPFG